MRVREFDPSHRGEAILFVKADWCPHCKVAKPELEVAAMQVGRLPVFAVDSERDKATIRKLNIDGYPTILYRSDRGRISKYVGPREGRRIADWACGRSSACLPRR